ncbi:MAG TPA: restriction endonuclease [Opitutaceae bacterium]|nr:restriction endonuclease [Opitutaceae bacterium]
MVFSLCVQALGPVALTAASADHQPAVGPGATRDEVIGAYGWPNGQSRSGTKEILSYDQGDVVLENGRVERVNFSPDVPWQQPRLRPPAATATTRKPAELPPAYWLTRLDTAQSVAVDRQIRILALFTGSDWSPACRLFHDEVENQPEFVAAFAGDFVFVKLDFPRGTPVPVRISPENIRARDRYGVTTYPTLLVLSPDGTQLARVNLAANSGVGSYRERVMAAVRLAKSATEGFATAAANPNPEAAPRSADSAAAATAGQQVTTRTALALKRALYLVGAAIGAAAILVVVFWRVLWRRREGPMPDMAKITGRIEAAAGGLPLASDMVAWPKQKLVAIVAGLAEVDEFAVRVRGGAGDADIELRRSGDISPRVLVCCAAGGAGAVGVKPVRALFGTMTAEGTDTGWFVSPKGFTTDALDYAGEHRITLIAVEGLQNMLAGVPPVALPGLLART